MKAFVAKFGIVATVVAGGAALGMLIPPATAQQRDPAYEQARAGGLVGEKPDGYLGFVVPPTPSIKALVDDLNIKRKALYTQRATEKAATVEQYAFTSGCNLIMQTRAGEKYQSPDGAWQTRGGGDPIRDSRCP